jgi:hypothetical protein
VALPTSEDDLFGEEALLDELDAADAAAAAARAADESSAPAATPPAAVRAIELPYADITLRAEADGATARVPRGVLALFSVALQRALRDAPDAPEVVLPG